MLIISLSWTLGEEDCLQLAKEGRRWTHNGGVTLISRPPTALLVELSGVFASFHFYATTKEARGQCFAIEAQTSDRVAARYWAKA